MRMEGAAFLNCRGIQCPFESICRNRDSYTDRRYGCETQDFIVAEAKKVRRVEPVSPPVYDHLDINPAAVLSEKGRSKLQLIKQIRNETGADLKTCKDALEYANWELPRARDYIKYGW